MKAKEIKYLAQGCSEGECQGLALFSWALSHNHRAPFPAMLSCPLWQSSRDFYQLSREGNLQVYNRNQDPARDPDLVHFSWCAVTADCCLWLFHLVVKQGLDSCFASLGDEHRFHSTAPLIFVALVRGRNLPFPCILAFLCAADHHSRGY